MLWGIRQRSRNVSALGAEQSFSLQCNFISVTFFDSHNTLVKETESVAGLRPTFETSSLLFQPHVDAALGLWIIPAGSGPGLQQLPMRACT